MTNEKTSLVFFGSGPVAAESLRLLSKNFALEAIITKPTTRTEMQAILPDSPLFVVSNKTDLDTLFSEHNFSSKLGVLIDFGIIISQKIIDYFPLGIINSHFSLLPELRGADPISFAILEGKNKTGVSLMLLVEAMDEGPVLATGELQLTGNETTPKLTDELIVLSNSLLIDTIPAYLQGKISLQTQNESTATYTRKFTKADGLIDWQKPANIIEKEIRAFAGWPKSYTNLNGIDCVITDANVIKAKGKTGNMFIHSKKLCIFCGHNALQINTIKPAGKKEMSSESFLAGYKVRLGL